MKPILHCKRYGAGDPLLILHGLFGCWDNWHLVARALAERFRVYVPDLRNHGHSFHSPRFDYEVMADDIQRLMDTLALEQAALLGHSMGGKLALRYAARSPQRVSKLVAVDITHRPSPPVHAEAVEALACLDLSSLKGLKDAEDRLRPAIPDHAVRLFLLKNLDRPPGGAYRWKVNLDAICRNLPLICGSVNIRRFSKPCLFIRGAGSDYIQESDWPEIRRLLPQARLVTIAASGHWPHVENQRDFLAAVSDFLIAP